MLLLYAYMNTYAYYIRFFPKRKGIPHSFVVSKAMIIFLRA